MVGHFLTDQAKMCIKLGPFIVMFVMS